jgi:hypothetical protein
MIEYKLSEVINSKTVRCVYSLDLVEFTVIWELDRDVFDLSYDVKSSVYEIRERVREALMAGETDENEDLELYLFIRDTFDATDCIRIIEKELRS